MMFADVFPAYAGMSLRDSSQPLSGSSFPRLRGDEPSLRVLDPTECVFSPPTRG